MKIWIDLDNTPHVPFFKPIIRELEKRGHEVVLTARDAFQVCDLAERMGLECKRVGRHHGKNSLMKVVGLGLRSAQLFPFLMREKPALSLSHGSRAQLLLSNLMGVPTVMIMDYEHAQTPLLLRPRWEIVPEVMMQARLHCKSRERVRAYNGIKEDVYAPQFKPDPGLAKELGLNSKDIIITVRPPANEAHYHNPESEAFFNEFMNRVHATHGVKAVLLPRNKSQETQIRARNPEWFKSGKVVIPARAVDGLNLLWHSDLVVSGGGTMNREAAALGIPVYSIFRGKIGAVDRQLAKEGRLLMIEKLSDIHQKIKLERRAHDQIKQIAKRNALDEILHHLQEILKKDCTNGITLPSPRRLPKVLVANE